MKNMIPALPALPVLTPTLVLDVPANNGLIMVQGWTLPITACGWDADGTLAARVTAIRGDVAWLQVRKLGGQVFFGGTCATGDDHLQFDLDWIATQEGVAFAA